MYVVPAVKVIVLPSCPICGKTEADEEGDVAGDEDEEGAGDDGEGLAVGRAVQCDPIPQLEPTRQFIVW